MERSSKEHTSARTGIGKKRRRANVRYNLRPLVARSDLLAKLREPITGASSGNTGESSGTNAEEDGGIPSDVEVEEAVPVTGDMSYVKVEEVDGPSGWLFPTNNSDYSSDEEMYGEKKVASETVLPFLTMKNFVEFEEKFKNLSIGVKGDAKMILLKDEDFTKEDNEADKVKHRDYIVWKEGKDALVSMLLTHLSPEVANLLRVQPTYDEAKSDLNLHKLWRLTRQVVQGKGSAGALAAARELLMCKQSGWDLAEYVSRFNDVATKLLGVKNTEKEVIQLILSCMFVAGLNQKQFEHQINKYVSGDDWTSYPEIAKELIQYDTSMRAIGGYDAKLFEDVNSSQAYEAKTQKTGNFPCFNCGETRDGHFARDCKKPRAVCKICGRSHLTDLHEEIMRLATGGRSERYRRPNDKQSSSASARSSNTSQGKSTDKKKDKKDAGKKTWQKDLRKMQKTMARLSQTLDGLQADAYAAENSDGSVDEDTQNFLREFEGQSESCEDDEEDANCNRLTISEGYDDAEIGARGAAVSTDVQEITALLARPGSSVIDTGCSNAHVLPTSWQKYLRNVKETRAYVNGVGGVRIKAVVEGQLGKFGRAVTVPNSTEALISLSLLLKSIPGSKFSGDLDILEFFDKDDDPLFKACNLGDGAWKIKEAELQRIAALAGRLDEPADPDDLDDEGDDLVLPPAVLPPLPEIINADDERRASLAYSICERLNHPGASAIRRGLANGSFLTEDTSVTRQDLDNALRKWGPCPACQEGKMRADPTQKKSDSPPAQHIGEVLHCDLLPLGNRARGGIENLFFAMDERSGYIHLIPLRGKDESFIRSAYWALEGKYKAYNHVIKSIQVDPESSLICIETFLNQQKVKLNKHPTAHHEKAAERNIQTLKGIRRAIAAGLMFDIDDLPILMAEHYQAAAFAMNCTPRKRTGANTPTFLFTGQKPTVPEFGFGTLGLMHTRSRGGDKRSEHGILLAPDRPHMHGVRVFSPGTSSIVSGVKFQPTRRIPDEWSIRVKRYVPVPAPAGLNPGQPSTVAPALAPITESVIEDQKGMDGDDDGHALDDAGHSPEPVASPPVQPTSAPKGNEGSSSSAPVRTDRKGTGKASKASKGITPVKKSAGSNTQVTRAAPEVSNEILDRPDPEPPPPVTAAGGRPQRVSKLPSKLRRVDVVVRRTSLKVALKDESELDLTYAAVNEEIDNMESNKVCEFVKYDDIPKTVRHLRGFAINTHMFLTDKKLASGLKDRKKARLVVNGNEESDLVVGETFSPTVNPISVLAQLNITTCRRYKLAAYDIKGAFLLAPVDKDKKKIYLRIPPEVAKLWVARYPKRKQCLSRDGSLFVVLNKYLYGLQESPHAFNKLLCEKLSEMGFEQSEADQCFYYKDTDDGRLLLSTHVDDLLFSCPSQLYRDWFETELEKTFEIKKQYDNISYLGMNITYDEKKHTMKVSQVGAVKEIVERVGCEWLNKFPKIPAVPDKLLEDYSEESSPCDKKEYLSLVMGMMYFARLTRPDVLMPVTALATRCAKPTEEDMNNLRRVVRYLAGTTDHGIVFDGSKPIKAEIFADASHNIHPDGRGHAGIVLTLGSAPIHCRSFKIKLVTRSSTESELFALEEATTYASWLKALLRDFGVPTWNDPIATHQDNKSAIIIATHGPSFKRFKHMLLRKAFVKERISAGDIILHYLKTDLMPADMLTKPLNAPQLVLHRNMLCITA